ncbi:MAG: PIN domain-containing protein [Chloroflexi bacterium]|nr:PIN domain-containing protein [Chloroflexota bacterium]
MATLELLDTNILLRHLRQDHPDHSPRATALLAQIERGELKVRLLDTVVFETVFTLQSFYREGRETIRNNLLPLIELPGIVLPDKRWLRDVFDLYVQERRLSFADCYHLVATRRLRLAGILSFDQDLDRIPGLTRREPPILPAPGR